MVFLRFSMVLLGFSMVFLRFSMVFLRFPIVFLRISMVWVNYHPRAAGGSEIKKIKKCRKTHRKIKKSLVPNPEIPASSHSTTVTAGIGRLRNQENQEMQENS